MAHECYQAKRIELNEKNIDNLLKFQGGVEENIKTIFKILKEIKENEIKHLNMKINALLFTVLCSVIVLIITTAIKNFIK